ncbi:MAG: tetratricopeptide repeat protein [Ignavibacteriae bacterium]|nr:tetratricopeptide repeat protein [Ignavibacteriota bacterium]
MKRIAIYIFLFLISTASYSQVNDYLLDRGINYIYRVQFDSAQLQFTEFTKQNPDAPEGYFFQAMLEWWKINLDKNNESNDENFTNKVNKVLEVCDRILDKDDNDFRATFYKGGALGYRGLLKSIRESWLRAAEDGREALNLLDKAAELQPNNKDALLGIGIYNYFAEYVPDRYPVVKPLMLLFPRGDKVKGLLQIKEVAINSRFAKTEANYILAYLYINYEKNYSEAEAYSKKLFTEFSENAVFERFLYTSYIGLSRLIDAIDGWKKVLEKGANKQTGYDNKHTLREANYYIAVALFNMKRILEAEVYLKDCESINSEIDRNNESSFTANTFLLLGAYYDAKGNHGKAEDYYDKVLSMKDFNTHRQAELYKKNGYK